MLQSLRDLIKRLDSFLEDIKRIREALERISPSSDPRHKGFYEPNRRTPPRNG